jgi:hypothetical protein
MQEKKMRTKSKCPLFSSKFSDAKCVQIIVPEDSVATPPGNQVSGERIGNIAREEAASLATFMDDNIYVLTDNNYFYALDYKFSCILSENLHHRVEG